MGSYNWIVFKNECPACQRLAKIHAQTHIASCYDGDESGRFHDRDYQIGQKMAWWPPEHIHFDTWSKYSDPKHSPAGVVEACYATCSHCGAELYAVIEFKDLVPTRVSSIGLESDWPSNYHR